MKDECNREGGQARPAPQQEGNDQQVEQETSVAEQVDYPLLGAQRSITGKLISSVNQVRIGSPRSQSLFSLASPP